MGDTNKRLDFIERRGGNSGRFCPTGMLSPFAGITAPYGWLVCDGSAVSRTDYPELFAVIGTLYGPGNGSTTFNLPNTNGRGIMGYDPAQAEFNVVGRVGGAKTHTLSVAEMPSHTHTQNSHNHTQNAHTHVQDAHNHVQNSHNHTQNPHTHLPSNGPNIVTNGGGTGAKIMYNGDSYALQTIANATATNNATTATNQAATATNQNTTATNIATTATNQNTGGGGAHNNLGPYLTMPHIIKT